MAVALACGICCSRRQLLRLQGDPTLACMFLDSFYGYWVHDVPPYLCQDCYCDCALRLEAQQKLTYQI